MRSRFSSTIILAMALSGLNGGRAVFATEPPPATTDAPRLQLSSPRNLQLPPTIGPKIPLTIDRVRQFAISPSAANALIASLTGAAIVSSSPAVTAGTSMPTDGDEAESRLHLRYSGRKDEALGKGIGGHFSIRPMTTPGAQAAAYNPLNSDAEQETALSTINISGVEMTVTAFMRYGPTPGHPQIYVAQKNGSQQMLPRKYSDISGDPAMAQNPYASLGVAPHRMYVIGTDYSYGFVRYPGGTHVWHSDDGGSTWQSKVDQNGQYILAWDESLIVDPQGHRWFDDKPSIAVSYYPSTRGVVYAAFLRYDLDSQPLYNPSQIFVLRSDDGGETFFATAILASNYVSPYPNYGPPSDDYAPQSPQIAVDSSTGNVFLFWLDWNRNHIYAAYAGPNGDVFTGINGLDSGLLLDPGTDFLPAALDGTHVRGRSMLSVRANWAAHNFGIVWHAREASPSSNTDVRFAALDAGSFAWSGPGGSPGVVNDSGGAGNDQWNAALDADGSGNWLVTFYDRRGPEVGGANLKYRLYAAKLTATGFRPPPDDTDVPITTADPSDPRHAFFSDSYELGEYQDVWYFNGLWRGSYIYAPDSAPSPDPTSYIDVYFSDILP